MSRRRQMNMIRKILADSRGANLVEYLILVGVIAIIALAGFKTFGSTVERKITEQNSTLNSQVR
jgi:Flp pilus assembly pilin Flp